jgi:hypothetical protein
MIAKKAVPLLILLSILLFACMTATAVPATPLATSTLTSLTDSTSIPAATETSIPAPVASETPIPTGTSLATMTSTIVPTYAILRGTINVERASCRYGPGAMYLYLYGLRQGANQDIIGRTDTGKWLLTRSRGDNKSCWVKADLFDIKGDVMSVEMVYPDKYKLPPSNQGYLSPWDVAAVRRADNQVVIDWKSEALRPGDGEGDEEGRASILYVVETWVCHAGQLIFTPVGVYGPQATVTDEPGCAQPSHGRVFFAEKHGYQGPSEIPWPAAGFGATATP